MRGLGSALALLTIAGAVGLITYAMYALRVPQRVEQTFQQVLQGPRKLAEAEAPESAGKKAEGRKTGRSGHPTGKLEAVIPRITIELQVPHLPFPRVESVKAGTSRAGLIKEFGTPAMMFTSIHEGQLREEYVYVGGASRATSVLLHDGEVIAARAQILAQRNRR